MGDLTAARRYAEHALAQRARQDDAYRLHYSRTIYYGVRGMTAPDAEAINGLHACLRFWESQDLPPWRANTLYYLAAALATAGETARAHDALDAAIHLNEAMGRQIALERCRALKAQLPISPQKPQIKTKVPLNPPFFKTLVRPPMDNRGGIHPIGGLME
jgi:hypothetical protein